MNVKYIQDKNGLRIFLNGELDECSASLARNKIDSIINDNLNSNRVIFNLSALTFMDSTGIGMLIGRYKKLKSHGVKTFIESPMPTVEKILEISGLYKIMPKV